MIPLLARAWEWVWQASLAGAVLVALVLVLQLAFRTKLPPRWRYALWLLVVARLLMPVAPASSMSLFNWVGWRSKVVGAPTSLASKSAKGADGAPTLLSQHLAPAIARDVDVAAATHSLSAVSSRPVSMIWREVVALGWLVGAVGYVLWVLGQQWRLASVLRRTGKLTTDARFLSLLQECRIALGVRSPVQAIETNLVSTPAICGFLRPRLLIPVSLKSGWDDRELRHVILHELVHVRRRDVLLNWILVLAQALHWFNPAVWFALRRLRAEREVLCDAIVLSHLQRGEHRAYGATLLKLVHAFSQPARLPSLASILNTPNEIERRMTMITQFKPSTRRAAFASAVLLLALAGFTFTRAADKDAPKPAQPEPVTAAAVQKAEATQRKRGILVLEEELAKQRDEIRRKQNELDALKEQLSITELDAAGAAAMSADNLRQLETERLSIAGEYLRLDSLYRQLTNFSRKELRMLLPTAYPDPLLSRLLEEEAITDQKLAESGNVKSLSHPEVTGLQRRQEKINKQIDERIDGIMAGLNARIAGLRNHRDVFQVESEKLKRKSIEEAISRRPYYQAKRELENLQAVVERLNARLWQEKVDAALPQGKGQ